MKPPVKIGLLVVALLIGIVLMIHLLSRGLKSGSASGVGAAVSIGKTETRTSMSSSSTSSSSDNSTFNSHRVLVFSDNPHPLCRRVAALLEEQLNNSPFIEFVAETNQPFTLTNGTATPDLFVTVNLVSLQESGVLSSTIKADFTASFGNMPWQSTSHSMHDSTPPVVDYEWKATQESESTFTGLHTDRYATIAELVATNFTQAICKQIEELSDKYPPLPKLPAEFYGPYQPVPDFESLTEVHARRVMSFCGLFTHNQTFWLFQTTITNPVPQLERIVGQLAAGGWKMTDIQLTNTPDYRIRGHLNGAELEVFRQRNGGFDRSDDNENSARLNFVVRYRQPFSRAEREAALSSLFEQPASVEQLLPFVHSFSNDKRRKFYELVESSPDTSPNACIQLAEYYQDQKRTNDAVRLLLRTRALAATLKDVASLESRISALARKISPKKDLKLTVTPEICRELGFVELTNLTQNIEQNCNFGQPLVFFGQGKREIRINSLTIDAPQKGSYPWAWVESEDGMRSSSWSSFTPNSKGEWEHSVTLDGRRFKITAVLMPEKSQVKFSVRAER